MTTDKGHYRPLLWPTSRGLMTGMAMASGILLAACNDNSSDNVSGNGSSDNNDDDAGQITFEVGTLAGTGGSISPQMQQAEPGEVLTFEIALESDYELRGVDGCDGELNGFTYTTGPIEAECTVTARFDAVEVTLLPPNPVTALAGNASVEIQWDDADNAEGYSLYWSTSPAIHPHVISSFEQQLEDVESPHTVVGLDNDTPYYFVVTSTLDGLESDASDEVSATPTAPAVPSRGLNDTGVDWCYNEDGEPIAQNGTAQQRADGCASVASALPGQDGLRGRDAIARQDQIDDTNELAKQGAGAAGFDFTKLDANGDPLPASATDWSCVQDHQTGLIWEVKTSSFGLQNRTNTYAWYNTDETTNGGEAGSAAGGSCWASDCNTQAYAEAVRATELCGLDNWRLPSRHELMSLRHSGIDSVPPIDEDYFPNTVTSAYWTATPSAQNTDQAWFIHFGNPSGSTGDPHIGTEGKHNTNRVRLVSGGAQ